MVLPRDSIVILFLIVSASAQSQVARHPDAHWVWPKDLDEAYRVDNYEITQRTCSIDQGSLCVFIRRDFDKEPILFFVHHRSVSVTLGHRKYLVLINDWLATKSGRVVVANLKSGIDAEVDRQVLSMYRRHAKPDRRLWVVPEAYEFSPDDRKILIRIVAADVSAATGEDSIKAFKTYKDWWYSVNSRTGRVIHEYRTSRIQRHW